MLLQDHRRCFSILLATNPTYHQQQYRDPFQSLSLSRQPKLVFGAGSSFSSCLYHTSWLCWYSQWLCFLLQCNCQRQLPFTQCHQKVQFYISSGMDFLWFLRWVNQLWQRWIWLWNEYQCLDRNSIFRWLWQVSNEESLVCPWSYSILKWYARLHLPQVVSDWANCFCHSNILYHLPQATRQYQGYKFSQASI